MQSVIVRVACLSVMLVSLAGCGGPKPAPAKSAAELTEAEKQQIRELNEQRTQEWGSAPKRK
jgi:hypothetical protein